MIFNDLFSKQSGSMEESFVGEVENNHA